MGQKMVSSLLPQEKYAYYKNHYVPTSSEALLQKEYLKGGKKKLSYQLSWLQNWHVYSKELQGGLCRVCILFDENKTGTLRGNFVKNAFQNLAKSEKIAEHEGTKYHQRSYEKAESFLRTFENPTEAVNHGKRRESNYEHNVHILKMIIEAVILCAEQGLALQGHRDMENLHLMTMMII